MHGNVFEFCQDWYDANYYLQGVGQDPAGPAAGTQRVARGGSWGYAADFQRCAFRGNANPDQGLNYFGFRCVRKQ
jgi:formylglycine-generating enzyme required for sulfatase activity